MNYRIEKVSDESGEDCFWAYIWKGPICYDVTAEEEKTKKQFPFTEEGIKEICSWLNKEEKNYNS